MTPHDRLAAIAAELRLLEERRVRLLAEQADLLLQERENHLAIFTTGDISTGSPSPSLALTSVISATSSPEDKIALFLSLFACRTEVYPRLWENPKTGRKGYAPACRNEWRPGICEKPRVKCTGCPHQAFPPLDDAAVRDHLTGRQTIGTYAIRADETCIFLAADFDGTGWQDDLSAYRRAAANIGLTVAAERSRSGNGGHGWLFFAEPIPALLARRLGTVLLARASVLHPALRLSAYDRFFPNQDTLPSGGFGNLIALPLQKPARDHGNSVFVDDDFQPYADQWKFLAMLKRLSRDELDTALRRASPDETAIPNSTSADDVEEPFHLQSDEAALDLIHASLTRELFPHEIEAVREAQLTIPLRDLPARLVAALKRLATFANPVFYEKQRLRFPTFDTPRFLFAGEVHPDRLVLPRSTMPDAIQLVKRAGGRLQINDRRPPAAHVHFDFNGVLTPPQQAAVTAVLAYEEGVLVAPPGAGKTVMACAAIARRGVKAVILVHRQALLEQWRERLAVFLGLGPREIHRLGGARRTANASVAVGMLPSVARSPDPGLLLSAYAHVIIDECHHVPAASFEAALKACPARFILGLTATPRRKDGLHKLLHFQCGPVRHRFVPEPFASTAPLPRRLIVRTTSPDLPAPDAPIHQLWSALVLSRLRNEQIATDIAACLGEGRALAVLSDRRDHLTNLQSHTTRFLTESSGRAGLRASANLYRIDGSTSRRERASILVEIAHDAETGRPFALFATASLLGEGFDLPRLDTLFLTTPISFSGRVVQYAGRLHRPHAAKTDVRVYDYYEPASRLSERMHRKRLRTLTELGYTLEEAFPCDWFSRSQ